MSNIGIMILILVIFVGIPGAVIGIYVFRKLIREMWFQNLVIKFAMVMLGCIGAIGLFIGTLLLWGYYHAESDYLAVHIEEVTGTLSDVEYYRSRTGNYFRLKLDDDRSYKLKEFYVDFDVKAWGKAFSNRKIVLYVKKYNWLEGFLVSEIFSDRYDGRIYGIGYPDGQVILEEEEVRRSYYNHYHDDANVRNGMRIIAVCLPMLFLSLLIWQKSKWRRKEP